MTGYQSKKAAALDEEGFYTIHPKDEDDDIQVYQRPWVGLTDVELDKLHGSPLSQEHSSLLLFVRDVEAKLKEKNNG